MRSHIYICMYVCMCVYTPFRDRREDLLKTQAGSLWWTEPGMGQCCWRDTTATAAAAAVGKLSMTESWETEGGFSSVRPLSLLCLASSSASDRNLNRPRETSPRKRNLIHQTKEKREKSISNFFLKKEMIFFKLRVLFDKLKFINNPNYNWFTPVNLTVQEWPPCETNDRRIASATEEPLHVNHLLLSRGTDIPHGRKESFTTSV